MNSNKVMFFIIIIYKVFNNNKVNYYSNLFNLKKCISLDLRGRKREGKS